MRQYLLSDFAENQSTSEKTSNKSLLQDISYKNIDL